MNIFYAVIDTNVLVSALLKSDSIPRKIISYIASKQLIPVFNEDIIKEYNEVLNRKKFGFQKTLVDDFLIEFIKIGQYVEGEKLEIEMPDTDDIKFYQVTMEKRKEDETYLITGNKKHFPIEWFIVTPREMLKIIEGNS